MPAGLTLASNGSLSGTATAGGSFNFTVTATDSSTGSGPYAGSQAYAFTVAAPIVTVAPATLPSATVGTAYSESITASGGIAPYSFAVTAGALPAGLTLASNGSLSGTATAGGSFNFTVTATDSSTGSGPYAGSQAYAFTVAAPTVTVAPATLPSAAVGSGYNETITASGGTAPYSYAVTAGVLPAGLTMGAGGVLSGTPTESGAFNFTISATDSSTGAGPFNGSQAYAFTVAAATVSLAPATLPAAAIGTAYSESITASGGTAPYSYSLTAGALPAGLVLAGDGTLSGTATESGSFNFTVTATDSSTGGGPFDGSQAYAFTVTAAAVSVAPATLPSATIGTSYNEAVTASGGTAPYSYAVTAGALPSGLTLAGDGTLSGTATAGGSFNFTITATDSSTGAGPYNGSQAYAFTVAAATVSIAPATLPSAAIGAVYNEAITASGGTAPYSYAVTAGALPAGLTLVSNGTLSGTATEAGSFNFTVTATDSSTGAGPYNGSRAYVFTVAAATVSVAPATLPSASIGTAYNEAITASGGTAPYSYAVTAGALPAGLTLAGDGTLSGTATAGGSFNFTVTATDSSTGTGPFNGSQAYAFTVAAPTVTVAPATLPDAMLGDAYNETVTASGGTAPYAFAISAGSLPAGLSLASDGSLSGTPTALGSFSFTVTATDGSGGTGPFAGSQAYTVNVAELAPVANPVAATVAYGSGASTITLDISGGAPASVAVASAASSGTTTVSGTSISYQPDAGFAGADSFTYTATNSAGTSAAATVSITVDAPIITASAADPLSTPIGSPYSQTFTWSGGAAPYSGYTVTGLPTGLAISASTTTSVTVSGTPTQAGTFALEATATDSSTGTGPFAHTGNFSLQVTAATPVIAPAAGVLTAGYATTYSQVFSASGGVAPYTFTLSGALPAGLVFDAASSTLSGTPSQSGSFPISVAVTDSSTGTGAPFSSSNAYTLEVAAPTLAVTPATLPDGTTGAAYSQALAASGGVAPYAFSISAGALPAGLSLSGGGDLAGTPTASGSFNFTVAIEDANGQPGSIAYSLSIISATLLLDPDTLPGGTAGVAYDALFGASGGVAPYTFAITAGALPAGLALDAAGALSGTPTVAGTFNFDVTVSDSAGTPSTTTRGYVLVIGAPVIAVAPPTLADGTVGTAYSQAITASGGTAPYTFAISAGALPAGLGLSAAGELTGTPTAPGDFGFDVTATDSLGFGGSATYTLRVIEAAPVAEDDIAETVAGQAVTVAVTENDQGDIDSVAVATVPANGTAAVSGLAIVYTPAAGFFGTDSFRYRATGPGGTSGDATVTITVESGAVPQGFPQSISALAGQAVTLYAALNASGGPFTGMTVVSAPATGTITVAGTDLQYTPFADASGTVSIGYTLENAFGSSALITSTVTVNPLPVPASTEVNTVAGVPAQVELTTGATGGPFIGADVVSISPASSGTASIAPGDSGGSSTFRLTFTPAPNFTGTAIVSFNLSNQFATSQAATVTVNVAARPDPSLDAEVLGVLNAQADATRRFATAQIGNFQQRLRAMHDGGVNAARFSNQLTFVTDRSCNEAMYLGTGRTCASAQPGDEQAPVSAQPGGSDQAPSAAEATALTVWTGGALGSGDRDRRNGSSSLSFETSGVSAGADYRVSEAFAFGAGVGYGRDRTDVGENGSRSDADNRTAAVYASWHPGDAFFLDGLLGYQWMSFDSQRYVGANGGTVQGERDGTQWFASISTGLNHHRGPLSVSPYARLDISRARLDGYTEHGDPVFALRIDQQDVDTTTGNLGLDIDYRKTMNWGVFAPELRLEYQHDFQGEGTTTLRYADLLAGPFYRADLNGFDRNRFMLGLGAAFYMQRDLTLRLEFRSLLGGQDDQSLLFNLEKKY
ncbi:MAG: putative Ig domain-containing protein [Pseudomonadota bacterium]|nr:putative Ig domain-containing protein [Pseudomonadota bacterium]